MARQKLIKNKCEIESCNITNPNVLELHHIIPRTNKNSSHHPYNLAILCPTHHKMIDTGELQIISIYPSTKQPNNRTLIYILNGIKNIDINEEYLPLKNKSYKIGV